MSLLRYHKPLASLSFPPVFVQLRIVVSTKNPPLRRSNCNKLLQNLQMTICGHCDYGKCKRDQCPGRCFDVIGQDPSVFGYMLHNIFNCYQLFHSNNISLQTPRIATYFDTLAILSVSFRPS
jgi:hypothetical protein